MIMPLSCPFTLFKRNKHYLVYNFQYTTQPIKRCFCILKVGKAEKESIVVQVQSQKNGMIRFN